MREPKTTPKTTTLDGNRQRALMRAMELQDSQQLSSEPSWSDSSDRRLMALAYALQVLDDPRPLVGSHGTLTDLFEANAISFREVRTPPDLLHSSRAVIVLLRRCSTTPKSRVGPSPYGMSLNANHSPTSFMQAGRAVCAPGHSCWSSA